MGNQAFTRGHLFVDVKQPNKESFLIMVSWSPSQSIKLFARLELG
jgi:hypothetical protein